MVGICSPFSIFIGLKRKKIGKTSKNKPSCSKFEDRYKCPCYQSEHLVTKTGKQRYSCKKWNKRFIIYYSYNAYYPDINQQIILYTEEGLGMRSTACALDIAITAQLKRIIVIADTIQLLPIAKGRTYEVDEMRTCIGRISRLRWIVYALDRESKRV